MPNIKFLAEIRAPEREVYHASAKVLKLCHCLRIVHEIDRKAGVLALWRPGLLSNKLRAHIIQHSTGFSSELSRDPTRDTVQADPLVLEVA